MVVTGLSFILFSANDPQKSAIGGFYLILVVFVVFAIYGAFERPKWGRTIRIVYYAIGLIGIPIGTIISIFALSAYGKGKKLFGDGKLTHKDLETVQ